MKYIGAIWMIGMLLIGSAVLQAQPQDWSDSCAPEAQMALAATTSALDYAALCDQFTSCDETTPVCQIRVALTLLDECAVEDSLCMTRSLLYSAVLRVFDSTQPYSFLYFKPADTSETLTNILTDFNAGRYDAALEPLLIEPNTIVTFDQPMLWLSKALLRQQTGDFDGAALTYQEALVQDFLSPLTYLARGLFHESQEQAERAAIDYFMLGQIVTDSQVTVWLEARQQRFPLMPDDGDIWLRYPTEDVGIGEVGSFDADLTVRPGVPIILSFYADDDLLMISNEASTTLQGDALSLFPDWLLLHRVRNDESGNVYVFLNRPESDQGGGSLSITFSEGLGSGRERIQYVLGAGDGSFMLAPEGAPDPRPREGARCNDGQRIRLTVGGQAGSLFGSGEVLLVDSPDGDSSTRAYTTNTAPAMILAGPVCVGQIAWWQVHIPEESTIGWTAEMRESDSSAWYVLTPLAAGEILQCEGAPATRLSPGAMGTVVAGLGANNLRNAASRTAEQVGALQEGDVFQVVAGPQCADGLTWWQVTAGDLTGWTAEGSDSTYWLEPLQQFEPFVGG